MRRTTPTARSATAAIAVVAISALTTGLVGTAASASHFRASGPDFSITGDTATWVVTTAWEANDADYFVGLGGTTEVLQLTSYADAPGSGTGTGVYLEVVGEEYEDQPLYAQTIETFSGDLSTLGDGMYEVYVDNCCRVDNIVNSGAEDFSQWVRFSKVGTTYQVAPRLTSPVIYTPLKLDGTTTMVSFAAPGAVTWTGVTDSSFPYYGSTALPCSSFVSGALEIGSEHCTGGDVYADLYTAGSFWAYKVMIADADGRQSVAETLFRVESLPEPYIDDHAWLDGGAGATFWAYAPDVLVNSWTLTCTNVADGTDVVTATSPTIPITLRGFTATETYDCVVSGTNGAGTGSSYEGDYEITAPDLKLELNFQVGDFYAGQTALLEGAGLDSESSYTLTMYSDPLLLDEGTTDVDGAFTNEVVVPQEACIPGEHELRLVGSSGGADVSASQYVEIDESCRVVTINGVGAQLAETGPRDLSPTTVLFALTLLLGGAMLLTARGTRRASRLTV